MPKFVTIQNLEQYNSKINPRIQDLEQVSDLGYLVNYIKQTQPVTYTVEIDGKTYTCKANADQSESLPKLSDIEDYYGFSQIKEYVETMKNTYLTLSGGNLTGSLTINNQEVATKDFVNDSINNLNSTYLGITAKAESAKSADSVSWDNVSDKSTTLSGYGITDAYTKAQVDKKVSDLVNSAPETLDTLNELANALGNDPNFATTVATQIGTKANDSDVVHTSGDETINGTKTFTSRIVGSIDKAESAKSADSVAWDNVSGKPSTFTPSSHTHDDRYYTESEIDTKLSGKSDTTHNHNSAYLGITAKAESAKSADSVAWNNVSGKPSSYTPSSHTHDDRYYTESEINTKLNGKSDTTHNHNSTYLGINAKAASAATADKLSTARSISLGNYDFQGSANFDGSANITLNATPYNCRVSQGNTNNFPYHYIGTTGLITGQYVDCSITLLVTRDFYDGGYGIISIILRTKDSGEDSTCEAKWLVRSVLPEDTIQVGLIKTSGKSYLDIYYKTTSGYQSCTFRCLGAGGRGEISRKFTLINSSEVNDTTTTNSKTSVGSYTSVNNGGSALRGSAYSSVVSASDSGNVNYAKSAGSVAWGNVSGRPTKVSQFTNDSGFITGITKAMVTNALGYTPPTKDTNTWNALKGSTTSAAGTAGYAPAPAAGAANRYLRCDGTWQVPPDNNTTYSNMTAATASAAGKAGLVPAPGAGKQTSFLRGDGTWVIPTNTTYSKLSQFTNDTGYITSSGSCNYATSAGNGVPVGSVFYFASASVPSGYLVCNGGAVSRTTYANLFNIIGTKFGSGNGSTTFNLPNLIDKFIQGNSTVGTSKSAGLPNITGSMGIGDMGGIAYALATGLNETGALGRKGNATVVSYATETLKDTNSGYGASINASYSSSVYGSSSTVQPPALTLLPCIKY